jgi:uncharacterized protein with von Willebrand factor type A (vWA) domain
MAERKISVAEAKRELAKYDSHVGAILKDMDRMWRRFSRRLKACKKAEMDLQAAAQKTKKL